MMRIAIQATPTVVTRHISRVILIAVVIFLLALVSRTAALGRFLMVLP